ncbi:MAG: 1-phosphofructokinase family hexose kinase [Coriobacteriales bacterium]|jgi:1-phosphofructokinase
MIYTVTMNPAVDCVMELSSFEPGAVNRSRGQELYFGGKGINVSTVLFELGCPTCVLGFIAGFTGQGLKSHLNTVGIPEKLISLDKGQTRINVKFRGSAGGRGVAAAGVETAVNAPGPVIGDNALAELGRLLETCQLGDSVVLTGGIPKGLAPGVYAELMEQHIGQGVRVVVDAVGEPLEAVLPRRPFLIKPNEDEIAEVLGLDDPTREQIVQGARELQVAGAANVLVSLGGNGALLCDEFGEVHEKAAPSGKLVNSVGAGDSMVAGFLCELERVISSGEPLDSGAYQSAFEFSLACGSATAFSPGLATRADIERLAGTI